MTDYRLSDLLDLSILQKMADAHYRAAGMPIGIIDAFDGSILVGAGWQDICVRYHRKHPVSLQRCRESDDYIKGRLVEGTACPYKCKNGLWDIGMPIVVEQDHLATMFLGQCFYEGEQPDRKFFARQAEQLGFDADAYLAALDRVPILSRAKVDYILEYDKALVAFVADLAGHALLRMRAEAERQKLQAQLAQAQKMETVGRLAGGVAHDFNNLLTIITGCAELALEDSAPSDPVQGNLRTIISAANRSANVVRQLLAFARRQTIAPRAIDLNRAVEELLLMLRRLIGENIDLVWKPCEGPCVLEMDPSQLDQVLTNLIANARDAISNVGRITIETATTSIDANYCEAHPGVDAGDYVRLTVSDDGRGMDQEILSCVFEPFFTTKRVGEGSGLGLATVYGIVQQNRGFVTAHSEPNRGSSFALYFPRYAGEQVAVAKPAPSRHQHGQETVLVVEDEAVILTLVKAQLTTLGYTVLAAQTPEEALRIARTFAGQIHLMIADVVMPEMNGWELARALLPLHPTLKHLFMSGYTAATIAPHGILEPGVRFIQKPFTKKELAAAVRDALDR